MWVSLAANAPFHSTPLAFQWATNHVPLGGLPNSVGRNKSRGKPRTGGCFLFPRIPSPFSPASHLSLPSDNGATGRRFVGSNIRRAITSDDRSEPFSWPYIDWMNHVSQLPLVVHSNSRTRSALGSLGRSRAVQPHISIRWPKPLARNDPVTPNS